jgi:hypothetical protein
MAYFASDNNDDDDEYLSRCAKPCIFAFKQSGSYGINVTQTLA